MNGSVSYRDILRHHANRMSQSQIASACGCARSTVQDVLKRAYEKGVTWEDVAGLSETAAYELIRGGRVRTRDCSRALPSEPDVRLSPHPAQARGLTDVRLVCGRTQSRTF